jgi:hypothetical protein
LIGQRPTSLDSLLLNAWYRLTIGRNLAETALALNSEEDNPDAQFATMYGLAGIWIVVYPAFAFAWLGFWATLRAFDLISHDSLIPVFAFGSAFCITGACDGLWRLILVMSARNNYRRAGKQLDATSGRLLRIARLNDGTILIQTIAGLVAALYVCSWR